MTKAKRSRRLVVCLRCEKTKFHEALNLHRVYAEEANRFPRSSPVIVQDTFTIE